MTNEVFVIGRLYCDMIFTGLSGMPELGRELFAPGLTVTAGGGAFITSAWLKHGGLSPRLVAEIGNDPFSAEISAAIDRHALDRSFVMRHDAPLPQITVAIPVGPERAFLSHLAAPAQKVDFPAMLDPHFARRKGLVHVCEMASMLHFAETIASARRHGAKISLDPSWDDTLIRDPAMHALIDQVDIFLPNEMEAKAITGLTDVEAACAALAQKIPVVAVKCGARGAVVSVDGRVIRVAPVAVEKIVDSTGAGDAFNAGFLATLARGGTLLAAVERGAVCGAQATTHAGGAPVPTREV